MSRFRQKRHRDVPGLNLASLPDLIFTVLFFFMGLVYIFIGKPVDAQGKVVSNETRIQLNDRFVSVDQLAQEITRERSQMSESDRQNMVVSIRADRDTEMGVINDVKQALRKAGALNINYSATSSHNPQKHN